MQGKSDWWGNQQLNIHGDAAVMKSAPIRREHIVLRTDLDRSHAGNAGITLPHKFCHLLELVN